MAIRLKNQDIARAAGNIFWLGMERVTQIGVAIFISGVLARYFGPTVFGQWQYANTLLLVLAPITWVCGAEILVPTIVNRHGEAGYNDAGGRDAGPGPGKPEFDKPGLGRPGLGQTGLSQTGGGQISLGQISPGQVSPGQVSPGQASLGQILGSAFVLRFSVSLLALLGTWAALAAGAADAVVGAMLAGLALTMVFREPFIGVINSWLQSLTHSKPQLLASMLVALGKAAAVFALVRVVASPTRFGWLWAIEAGLIAALMVGYYMARHGGRLDWHPRKALVKRFATDGSVFWIGLICMYLFLKLDRLMLQHFVDYAELGRYSAAQQLNENWIALALMLAQTLAPAFVYRLPDGPQLRRNLWRLMGMTAVLMAIGAALLDLIGGFLIARIFGPGYAGAIEIFRWAVWLSVPAGVEAIGNLLVLKAQAKYVVLVKWLLALAIAALVDLFAIPALGGPGALLGLAAGYATAVAVNLYYLHARLGQAVFP